MEQRRLLTQRICIRKGDAEHLQFINWSRNNIEHVSHTPRAYRGKVEWKATYTVAQIKGELIDTKWLVSKGLSKNRVSAAKLLNRHTKSGVLSSANIPKKLSDC